MRNKTQRPKSQRMLLWWLALLVAPHAWAVDIERVEPPFWWLGYQDSQLQLLVYGDDVSTLRASVEHAGVSVERVVRVQNPNYLFVYLRIAPDAAAGQFDIRFVGDRDTLTHRYELRERNSDPAHTQGFSTRDAIYLITPDRFANGSPDNDNIRGMGDRVDRDKLGGRHGGDIAGIAASLDYLERMGFTAIWLNPVLENKMPTYSYHGYSTTDFYRVDPRYGSNEDYRKLVANAKSRGIGTIMDMIVNHIGSEHWWMDDLPMQDWINNVSDFTITTHMRTTWQDPYASQKDTSGFADGWFDKHMPDLNQRNEILGDYLVQNALWWIEYLGLAGIRMDTYPYPDKHYMTDWTRRVMTEYPNFNIVGEEWSLNPVTVSYWQRGKINHDGYESELPSVMDFPLREALRDSLIAPAPQWGSSWEPAYVMLGNDFLYPDPNALVVFPDNHDMSRIFTQLNEDYDLYRMAIAYTLTMRGVPQIYYGTEILMVNRESTDHGLIRSDFPGGWAGDKTNAYTGAGLTEQQKDAQDFMRTLLTWRKNKDVIHDGKLMHYSPDGETYAFFRYDDSDSVMVVFNKGTETARLDAARFSERLGGRRAARDVITGRSLDISESITVPARSVLVLEIEP